MDGFAVHSIQLGSSPRLSHKTRRLRIAVCVDEPVSTLSVVCVFLFWGLFSFLGGGGEGGKVYFLLLT